LKAQGLDYKNQGLTCKGSIWWGDRLANSEKVRDSLAKMSAHTLALTGMLLLTGG
jgi:hypothetical protein